MRWASLINRKQRAPFRHNRTFRPGIELLEDRVTPTAVTFMNDNWFLATDNGAAGLSVGDIVDNRIDTGGPATVTATYGIDGFGVVGGSSLAGSATIADAITNTDVGGTLNVLQGNYNEAVVVNKSLALLGAQSSTNAIGRTAVPESIITASSGVAVIDIAASNVVVAGFTIQGNNAGPGVASLATVSGFNIRNNIIQNNVIGIELASNGTNLSIVEQNDVQNNNQAGAPVGGFGLHSILPLSNTSIRFNRFSGNATAGAQLLGSAGTPITNVTILGNQFANNDRLEVADFDNSAINGNTFTADISGGGPSATLHVGGGSDNLSVSFNTFTDLRFPALALDAALAATNNANVKIVGNVIRQDVSLFTGTNPIVNEIDVTSATGVSLISENLIFLRGTAPGGITAVNGIRLDAAVLGTMNVTGNIVLADGVGGVGSANLKLDSNLVAATQINVTSNTFRGGALGIDIVQGAGGLAQLQVHLNNILGHTTAGLRLAGSGTVNATENFWGAFSGPSNSGNPGGTGDIASVSGGGALSLLPFHTIPQLPFGDDFTAVNGSVLGDAWIQAVGSFTVQGNALLAGGAPINLAGLSAPTRDAYLQADVTLAAGDSHAGLIARYSGAGDQNFYVGLLTRVGGSLFAQIYRNVNGTFTILDSEVVAVSTATLRFEVVGNSLRLFVNGVLTAHATDSAIAGPGLTGIRSSAGVSYDHFVSGLTPAAQALMPLADSFVLAANTTLGSPWTSLVGTFSIQNQTAVGTQTLNLATIGGDASDVSVQIRATVGASFTHAGVVARHSGPGDTNMYMGVLVNFNGSLFAQIYRNLNGSWVLLSSAMVGVGGTVTLRFDVIGTSLRLFVNGSLATSTSDSALITGKVGIRASAGTTIDDFSATQRLQLVTPIPFLDNFTGLNGASLSEFWQQRLGNITVQGNAAALGEGLNLATLIQGAVDNVSVSATVTLGGADGSHVGLVARYGGTGDANMYLGVIVRNGGTISAQIYRNINGAWTLLSTATITSAASYNVRFDVVGDSLKLFVNGALATHTFDSMLAAGQVGLRGSVDGVLDNFNLAKHDLTPVKITGAIANAVGTPIVITSFGHGLDTGDQVTVAGVTGNTAANGTWTITVTDDDHFSLNGSASSGSYTGGGVWTTTFDEPFNVTADNQLSANWRERVGNFSVQTAAAVGQDAVNLATVTGLTLTNSSQSADVTLVGDTFAGLIARYTGPGDSNMYFATLLQVGSTVHAQIYLNLGGVWTTLSSSVVSVSGTVNLRFDVVGTSLRLYVNGVLATFAFDANLTSGQVGIRSAVDASIDNFQVEGA